MTRRGLWGHMLVIVATLSGIVGMGMMFDAVMHADALAVARAAPLLLLGLWWAGRALGQSMIASKHRRNMASVECLRPLNGK